MPRLINAKTGVIVNVDDATVNQLNKDWSEVGSKSRSEAPDNTWKVAELKAHAEESGVDLGEATKKEDVLAAIRAASISE